MKWFNNPETLEDLKKQYKKLAFQNHPDRGGKTSDMQEINAEYEALFSRLKDTHKNAEGEFYTARTATTETATEFMDIIEKLIHMEGIEIEVCGSWVWVTGDTQAAQGRAESPVFPVEQQQIRVVFPPRRIQEAEQEVSDAGRDQRLLRKREDRKRG